MTNVPSALLDDYSELNSGKLGSGNRPNISSKILMSAIQCLVLVPFKDRSTVQIERVEKIVLSILEDVHHPSIGMHIRVFLQFCNLGPMFCTSLLSVSCYVLLRRNFTFCETK